MGMTEPQGIQIQLYCRKYNEALYTDQAGSVAPVVSVNKQINTAIAPPPVSGIVLAEAYHVQRDGTVLSYIAGICVFPESILAGNAVVEYSEDDGSTWLYSGTISTGAFSIDSVKTGVSYLVRIKAGSRFTSGLYSDWLVSDLITIVGKDDPPNPVSDFACTNSDGGFALSWTANTEPDLKTYRVYAGTDSAAFVDCTLLADNILITTLQVLLSTPGDYIFYIVAVDKSLNISDPVSVIGTIEEGV